MQHTRTNLRYFVLILLIRVSIFINNNFSSIVFQIERVGPNAGFFTEEIVLNRVPSLLLILAGCYLFLGILGSLMICQPPEDWVQRRSVPTSEVEAQESEKNDSKKSEKDILSHDHTDDDDCYIHWKDALKSKEFYLLWITRLSVVLITQVVSVQGLVILEKKIEIAALE